MGRAGYCINHPQRPADIRCIQCHKALCGDCVIRDEGDPFCSKKCASRYRAFVRSAESAKTSVVTTVQRIATVILVLLIIGALLFVAGAVLHVPVLKEMSDSIKRVVF